MGRRAQPKYMELEKLFKLKIKRFSSSYRGEHKRMKALSSLLTLSSVEWDKEGNLISTDPGIYSTDKTFEKEQKWSWDRRKTELLKEIQEYKKEIEGYDDEYDIKFNNRLLKTREETVEKYFTEFEPYQDEFEDIHNSKFLKKEEIKDWLRPDNVGYGVLEHIPNNAQDESLEVIKEYIEFIFDNFEHVGQIMTDIAKNVNARYFRDKKIDQILS